MTSKKEQTHQRMLESMHQTFRQHGYNGVGVNALANESGVTSGAFYAHFGSKSGAFQEVVTEGVHQLDEAIKQFQESYADNWLEQFVSFYMSEKRRCDLRQSCALQSLTPEVTRAGEEIREVFQNELLTVIETFNKGATSSSSKGSNDHAWATLATLIGGVTLARAVKDTVLADEIANAVQKAITV